MASTCPNCQSTRTRRGGAVIWAIYLVLILAAVPLVLLWNVNAAIVAGIMIAAVVLAHLLVNQRVCLDCGQQWRGK